MQYIEEPVASWEDSLTFYQETGVPIALDESLEHALCQVRLLSRLAFSYGAHTQSDWT